MDRLNRSTPVLLRLQLPNERKPHDPTDRCAQLLFGVSNYPPLKMR